MEEGEGQRGGGGGGGGGVGVAGGAATTSPHPPNPPTTPPTPGTIRENLANLLELKKVHEERLHRIEEELSHLHRFKKDYEQLYKRLKSLPDKTQHEVMVPLGRLALMPGQLVHTNEVLVLLGDNWFAERSARQATEIVRRRIKDCEDKIRSAENNRRLHSGWLSEAEELLAGEEGQQVEILEELTEEEYQRSKEDHRRRVAQEYTRLREAAPKQQPQRPQSPPNPPSPPAPPDPFLEGLGEGERQSYEELMRRLDQLELEEMGEAMEPLEEEDAEDDDVDEEEEEEEEEEEGEDERQKIIPSPQTKNRKLKFRRRLKSADNDDASDLGRRWRKGLIGGTASMDNTDTASDSDTDRGDIAGALAKRQGRLRRRVSWADDIRPLYTIIPDDSSEEVHRIPYTSTPAALDTPADPPHPSKPPNLPLEAVESTQSDAGDIQSPSDLYRVFGHSSTEGSQPPASSLPPTAPSSAPPVPGLDPGTPPPRSILKKSKSLPMGDGEDADGGLAGGVGWCCPPKPLDLEGEEEEEEEGAKVGDGEKGLKHPATPPPPPSPPPKRAGSFKSAFTYRVLEHSAAAAGDGDTPAPPKKISKFRAARNKN